MGGSGAGRGRESLKETGRAESERNTEQFAYTVAEIESERDVTLAIHSPAFVYKHRVLFIYAVFWRETGGTTGGGYHCPDLPISRNLYIHSFSLSFFSRSSNSFQISFKNLINFSC